MKQATNESVLMTESDLRELAERGAAELANASAEELLRWTNENFGDSYVVASNMQDAVLVEMAAKVRPGVDVLFLDTGYHFAETIGTRDAVEAVYDVHIVNVTAENTVPEQDELFGKDLFAREPAECCRMRKVEPLGKALSGYSAWVTGIRRVEAPDPGQCAADQLRRGVQARQDQPAGGMVGRRYAVLHRQQRHPGEPFGRRGLSVHRLRAVHRQAPAGLRPAQRPLAGPGQDRMRAARFVSAGSVARSAHSSLPLLLTAHGSADPRSAAVTHAIAGRIRRLRHDLDVRVAFCEQNSPNLRDALAEFHDPRRPAVVTPLLLADAYHARVDIPALIEAAGAHVRQAPVLGEDPALLDVLRQRLSEAGVSPDDSDVGVMVVAVGSSNPVANARTAFVASALQAGTRWAGARTAFATGPQPTDINRRWPTRWSDYRPPARVGSSLHRGSWRMAESPTALLITLARTIFR